jgi:hypothetical protein
MQCSICDPAKIILISKFSYSLFSNPTHKTKIGTANRWDATLTNQWADYYYWSIRKKEQQSDHIYCTLLWLVLGFAVPYTSLSKLYKNAGPNPFCLAKWAYFHFSSSNINLQGHIRSTSGVVLRMVLLFLLNVINERMPVLTSLGKRKKQKQFILYKFKLTFKGFTIDFWCGPIELQSDSFVTNMQTTNFYFLLFPLFFLVHGAPTPLLNVSQAVGWQENQLQIPIKEAQLFLQVSVWKRLSS